jgi:argonaute-like protein implicated in RNA metabolism and viral defense
VGVAPKKKKAWKPKVSTPKKEDTSSSSLPSTTQPKQNLVYYGITLRPTEGEVLDDLPPILTDSDESSKNEFTEKVNRTFLNHTTTLANATSGADQVSVMTEPVEAQPASEENPASSKVTPTDTIMEE